MLPAPPPPSTGFSRRGLLKAAGIGGVALLGGGWVVHTLRGFGPPVAGRFVFDAIEYDVVEKMGEAFFPGAPDWPFTAAEVDVPRFVDLYVSELYPDSQQLFRMLVRTLNVSSIVSHGAAFRFLPLARRADVLVGWRESTFRVRRAGYLALSGVFHMGYFEDERVRAAGGYVTGCDLSAGPERPDLWVMKGVAR
ncbi:MAG: twin-arginine translocation signal domain-containing protein [Archangium sp.]|nr:twin-arginine translocation signal domain-containing protein [Archangium sp.]